MGRRIALLLCLWSMAICVYSSQVIMKRHKDHEHAILSSSSAYAANPDSDVDECVSNPADPSCVDYVLPDSVVASSINGLCGSMSTMPGCTIYHLCQNKKYSKSPQCMPFVIYKELCTDMPRMSDCASYTSMCSNVSVVSECTDMDTDVIPLPSSKTAAQQIQTMCGEMPMSGCAECTANMGSCEVLKVYSDLCLSMPDMGECAQWNTMCAVIPTWPLCTSKGSDHPIPEMRMYFHASILDYVLFKQWVPTNTVSYILTWVAVFLFAILFEAFKLYRSRLERKWKAEADGDSTEVLLGHGKNEEMGNSGHVYRGPNFNVKRDVGRAVIHFLEVGWGLLLMLVAMTFNIGLFLAVCIGAFFGMLFVGRYIHYVPRASCH